MRKTTVLVLLLCLMLGAQEIGARYLIITHDSFYDAVTPLAWWKHKKGMRTKVVRLSEIGYNAASIRSYITTAYNTWQIPPEFILLVGAPNYLPMPTMSGTFSDNYYTNITGTIYNEMLSGRLTVHSLSETQNVINKILLYERTPYMTDTSWFTRACLVARMGYDPDDSIYWYDTYYTAQHLINNGYTDIDTLSQYFGHNTSHLLASVNSGRSIVMYRGAAVNNWYSPFNVNPHQTQNNMMVPIVLSITCRTMGTGSTSATAEYWLLTGSLSTPRGAAGYFATTTTVINQAYLRSAVTQGFFDAIFEDGTQIFGEACEAGRKRVYQMYQYAGGSKEYYGFTTLGDPEMNIWTAAPKTITVTHDFVLYTGPETLNVTVDYLENPVAGANVCIVFDSTVYETGQTAANGTIRFALDLPHAGNMDITVTGRNLYPYEAIIPVIETGINEKIHFMGADRVFLQTSPNPASTTIAMFYSIPPGCSGELSILDAKGSLIRTFPVMSSNVSQTRTVYWNGRDETGRDVGSGIYFAVINLYPKDRLFTKPAKFIFLP